MGSVGGVPGYAGGSAPASDDVDVLNSCEGAAGDFLCRIEHLVLDVGARECG